MFHALNEKDELLTIYQLAPDDILQMKKEASFYCPDCREALLLRSGPLTTPHFAHFPSSLCTRKRGGESEVHEKGKLLLYDWLYHQGYRVEMEPYLSDISQRPDLMLTIGEKRIVLELQCSTISPEEVKKRSEGYHTMNIFPLWLLGGRQFFRSGRSLLKTNSFHRVLHYHFHNQYFLYFFDVTQRAIVTASPLQSLSPSMNISAFSHFPLSSSRFTQLFTACHKKNPSFYSLWLKQMSRYRTTYRKNAGSEERQLRQLLYLRSMHFSLIPSLCYLPVKSQLLSAKPAYIWQTRFVVDHFMKRPSGAQIYVPPSMKLSALNDYEADLLEEYLAALSVFNIVKKISPFKWVKLKDINWPKHVEEALKEDEKVINHLKKSTYMAGF
ncbi:competence protein CoiA [Halobacillus sp. Marseille-Q1614]|uniref:competence protein CoiA n=1 Tax=Halobacillus sp. Marseille-Q1614 TaxID=2709134 RepID=UPI0015706920|nr:competence protein CoiA family protein [Halobacillus sp. Marseille-Q1614]